MYGHVMTLRDALSRQKRSVGCPKLPVAKTTGFWPVVDKRITQWASFNIDSLNESYGHVLDLPLPFGAVLALPSVDELHNISEGGIEGPRQLMEWTDSVVRPVLTYAKTHLRLREGTALRFPTNAPTRHGRFSGIVPNLDAHTHIDNAIGLHDYSQQALVVGISRAAVAWQPGALPCNPKNRDVWPVRQVANLCMVANCRYGYIQTDEALVVMCFSRVPEPTDSLALVTNGSPNSIDKAEGPSPTKDEPLPLHVQYMPVPWNTEHVEGRCATLTTEMALWWLCMLALADRPRSLVPVDQVVPIDTWVPALLDDGTIVDRHYYSNVDRPKTTVTPASLSGITAPGTDLDVFRFGMSLTFRRDNNGL